MKRTDPSPKRALTLPRCHLLTTLFAKYERRAASTPSPLTPGGPAVGRSPGFRLGRVDAIDVEDLILCLREVDAARQGQLPEVKSLTDQGREWAGRIAASLRKSGATAVFFRDDEVAGGAISEFLKRGIRVPEDLSVVSMDGHPLAGLFQVPLTTLALPVESMVRKTIQLACSDTPPTACLLSCKLIVRSSHSDASA